MLAPTLQTPSDLLNKLLREQHRAFHAPHPSHVADHLYNFCVTALALRDHLFAFQSFDDVAKRQFHERWSEEPVRVACREIANTVKHAVLKKQSRTKAAIQSTSRVVNVYRAQDGEIVTAPESHPTIVVLLSDHTTVDVWELTQAVIEFWRSYFSTHQINHQPQPEAELFGSQRREAPSRPIPGGPTGEETCT